LFERFLGKAPESLLQEKKLSHAAAQRRNENRCAVAPPREKTTS
jgi:hypothetical protein